MEREKLISLVTAAQRGDPDALNQLFNTFYNDVYYFALKTVKDDQIACDITQEAFIEIINTLGNLQEPAAFVKWMKQITYHQCTRYFKKKTDITVDEDEDGNTVFDTLEEEKAEFIPDKALDLADFKKTIMDMIDELSEEQRSAVMMFYFDELSIKQIAEIQNTSENTVKSRLNYARKGIKKSVEDYEKKTGIKLHCVGVLPLLLWLFREYFAQALPASAANVAKGVAAATGVSVSSAAATTAVTATVGIGVKIAALPITTKIIAGTIAVLIAIGGGTAAAILLGGDQDPKKSSVSKEDSDDTDENPWDDTDETPSDDGDDTPPDSTGTPTQPSASPRYDPSRRSASTLTAEDVVSRALKNIQNISGGTDIATYDEAYTASCFKDLDIFGYNLTAEEITEKDWGYVTFRTKLLGEEKEVAFQSVSANTRLPFETKEEVIAAAKQDLVRIFRFLDGQGYPKLTIAGKNYMAKPTLSIEKVEQLAEEHCASLLEAGNIYVTSQTPLVIDGQSYNFTFKILAARADGFYHYYTEFNITAATN